MWRLETTSAFVRDILSASQDTTLAVWDRPTGNRVGNWAASGAIYCAALTPDGNVIAMGDGSGAVRFLDVVERARFSAER